MPARYQEFDLILNNNLMIKLGLYQYWSSDHDVGFINQQ